MRSEQNKNGVCEVCLATTHQNKLILASLAKKLKKLSLEAAFSQNQDDTNHTENQGLARLLMALHLVKRPLKHYHQPCKHHFWLKRFKKYLVCSPQRVDYLFHLISSMISQKSYHIFLLQSQIRNCKGRSFMMVDHGQPQMHAVKLQQRPVSPQAAIQIPNRGVIYEVKEEVQVQGTIFHGQGSFSTIQEYGSLVFDSGAGLWNQQPFPPNKQ